MAVNNIVKRLQNIMRQDAGINGDAQRIELRAQAQLRVQPEIVHRFSQRLFFGHNHHPVFSMPGCACSMQFALAGRYDMCYANKHEIVFM